MKRTQYTVTVENHTARFSALRHAMLFAQMMSREMLGHLVEVGSKDGLRGQYHSGQPTPEFKQHHISGIFR
jgi:hypothetical protein